MASDTCGTCTWLITKDGSLVIKPTSGKVGELGEWSDSEPAPWHEYSSWITSASFEGTVKAKTCRSMFYRCSDLSSVDLTGLDTSAVTDMYQMFGYCSRLSKIDLSGLDTSHVTNMSRMFDSCSSLASISLAGLDVSRVTDMSIMFSGCDRLASADLTGLRASNLTDMSYMFDCCTSLTSVNLAGFTTPKALNMKWMFDACYALVSLDMSAVDIPNVVNMGYMFDGCDSLATVDLSGLGVSGSTEDSYMFYKCKSLKTVYVSDRWLSPVHYTTAQKSSTPLFTGCESIVGGRGTKYDLNHLSREYARIDAPEVPGYFTDKDAARKTPIDGAVIAPIPDQVFTGTEVTPRVSVTLNGKALAEGTDYRVVYEDNFGSGTAVAIVRGIGAYTSARKVSFKIVSAGSNTPSFSLVDLSGAVVTGVKDKAYQGGEPVTQKPTVTLGGKTLKENQDYVLHYENNVNVGTANVTVFGFGNYTGQVPKTFKITKAANKLTVKAKKLKVQAKSLKSRAYKAFPFSKVSAHGLVSFTYVKSSGHKNLTVKKSTGMMTVKKKTKAGTYKMKVKVTAKGDANYKQASKTVTVKVTVK